jgi:hypothetical protein
MAALSEEEQAKYGEEIAGLLMLRKKRNGRYRTSWGDKTALGLFRTMTKVIDVPRKIIWHDGKEM